MEHTPIKLTTLASAAGCAAKLGPGDLSKAILPLDQLFDPADFPALLVGLREPDDAAVMRLNDQQALILTTDFFPPVVDDPYWYGAIAAANAMSDVYAMGGEVLMALNLLAFPAELDTFVMSEILRGGGEKVRESGGALVGGHTIMDHEPKYGLAVTGMVHPDQIIPKGGAQIGDALVLTKPLGAGIITTALKRGIAEDEVVQTAMASMASLNRTGARLAQKYGVHGMSDITGYSLMGHGYEMAKLSGHDLHIYFDALHWLPGAQEYADQQIFPGGMGRNRAYYSQWITTMPDDPVIQGMLYDPQTSGGLLMAVPAENVESLLRDLEQAGVNARQIGEVRAGSGTVVIA